MKKIILVCALAFGLSGCVEDLKQAAGSFLAPIATVKNPVTPKMLYQMEAGGVVVFASLNGYKQLCIQRVIPESCVGVIQKLQSYTRRLPPILKNLRIFVKNNDQVNAVVMYNTARNLITDFRTVAVENGVRVD